MMMANKSHGTSPRPLAAVLLIVLAGADGRSSGAAPESVTVQPRTTQTTFFANETVDFRLELAAEDSVEGSLNWQFSTLHRSLGRGDLQVKVEPGKPAAVSFRLRTPHVKDGVLQAAEIKASLKSGNGDEPVIIFERELWIFPRNPFAGRQQWLADLDLQLFDPEGRTAELFEDADIPFREARSVTRLLASEGGMVIVGEGIQMREHSGLADALIELAAEGRRVLWLGPAEGKFLFPGSEGFLGKPPKSLSFFGSDMIARLDKRFDADLWSSQENSRSVGLGISARRDHCYVEIVEPTGGWSWMHAEFAEPDGEFILCGLQIVEGWETSPTPRFMLARLLETMNESNEITEVTNE